MRRDFFVPCRYCAGSPAPGKMKKAQRAGSFFPGTNQPADLQKAPSSMG